MSLCELSIALSVVFGFLLLGFAAQLYYFLWWRNNTPTTTTTTHSSDIEMAQKNNNNSYPSKGLFHYWVCWKVPRTVHNATTNTSGNVAKVHETEFNNNNVNGGGEEGGASSVELELMRLHNLAGPPRFLFTIKEETKEDLLESEDRKSRSLSDLMCAIDTPFSSSPSFNCSLEFNPLFESSSLSSSSEEEEEESEFNRFRSSPPPKFKFLRDAEEKLYRRLVEEGRRKLHRHQHVTGSSQVLPLPSSPSTFPSSNILH